MPQRADMVPELEIFTAIDTHSRAACHIRATRTWLGGPSWPPIGICRGSREGRHEYKHRGPTLMDRAVCRRWRRRAPLAQLNRMAPLSSCYVVG